MTTERIDVLAVYDAAIFQRRRKLQRMTEKGWPERQVQRQAAHLAEAEQARAAVAELIEAAKLANGDHTAPHDCYATGPMTGDAYLDLVRCPGCQLAAALARVGGAS